MFHFFFFHYTPTTESNTYCHTLPLHDALPILILTRRPAKPSVDINWRKRSGTVPATAWESRFTRRRELDHDERRPATRRRPQMTRSNLEWYSPSRSEEHTSELRSLMRISYAVFCLKKKKTPHITTR